jgi:membrane protease subunit HflC
MNRIGFIVSSLLVGLALLSSMIFCRGSAPVWRGLCAGPDQGSHYRAWAQLQTAPPFQNVSYLDKRLLTLDSTDAEPVLTAEKQRW